MVSNMNTTDTLRNGTRVEDNGRRYGFGQILRSDGNEYEVLWFTPNRFTTWEHRQTLHVVKKKSNMQ
jgi:hypothetical protein